MCMPLCACTHVHLCMCACAHNLYVYVCAHTICGHPCDRPPMATLSRSMGPRRYEQQTMSHSHSAWCRAYALQGQRALDRPMAVTQCGRGALALGGKRFGRVRWWGSSGLRWAAVACVRGRPGAGSAHMQHDWAFDCGGELVESAGFLAWARLRDEIPGYLWWPGISARS